MLPESRAARLQAGAVQLQRQGRALRGVPGRRDEAHRDELPAGRLCHLRRLPRQALQPETLQVKYKGFRSRICSIRRSRTRCRCWKTPQIQPSCKRCYDVGLGYINLGQSSTTLSGGEAQRIKLARELSRADRQARFTFSMSRRRGCISRMCGKLLDVLHRLVDLGNTVIVIEHTRRDQDGGLDHRSRPRRRRTRRRDRGQIRGFCRRRAHHDGTRCL
jgi:excinuclease ABC subunit A